jgi:hypothetical protein
MTKSSNEPEEEFLGERLGPPGAKYSLQQPPTIVLPGFGRRLHRIRHPRPTEWEEVTDDTICTHTPQLCCILCT